MIENGYFCNMIFVDTHTHLYLDAFDEDRDAMMGRAKDQGVTHFMLPDIDRESRERMFQMQTDFAGCHAMAGLHPTSVKADYEEELASALELLNGDAVIGVGECGIDRYWDLEHIVLQKEAFATQLQWSLERDLPVSIHIRDAFEDVFEVLSRFGKTRFKGVFHCFTGGLDEAEKAMAYGFHLGIGGIVTFKKSHLPEVLKQISPEKIVLESDAPFLAPAPYRGKRNEPSYLPLVAEKIAGVYHMSLSEVACITTHNALTLFKPELS
jgi:TatD DNase family protein